MCRQVAPLQKGCLIYEEIDHELQNQQLQRADWDNRGKF
jgi:hypothetical protein